ncbi:hypothetical protein GCWU000324_02029 [Kingella oralis ATCC 51147]|uniref:Uncharacterized protein n=1 Tax=Kingella oralis ATCC 51147 TaxID=629741 RepID=C4GJ07_9NEIS|nr:hypothetical protein GCWU000324_02029 [Kingella oralis ATCC 51147]
MRQPENDILDILTDWGGNKHFLCQTLMGDGKVFKGVLDNEPSLRH